MLQTLRQIWSRGSYGGLGLSWLNSIQRVMRSVLLNTHDPEDIEPDPFFNILGGNYGKLILTAGSAVVKGYNSDYQIVDFYVLNADHPVYEGYFQYVVCNAASIIFEGYELNNEV